MSTSEELDLAIIGAGLAGLVHLHYARRAGLSALVLEQQDGVGGLWRTLPRWQDIQIRPADWTLEGLAINGPAQPEILANVQSWVERFSLTDGIRLNCPVRVARHNGSCWELETPQGTVRARHLVAATGGHNKPDIPEVQRQASAVRELHSSELTDLGELRGREVLVVGGGASAFDLLDQAIAHQARRIHWVYRNVRWFTPTKQPKAVAGSLRPYTKMQAGGMPMEQRNAVIDADLRGRYAKFGIQEIQPERPIDLHHDQLIPGRALMLANFAQIERQQATVRSIDAQTVTLSNGLRLSPDLLLWGTGYDTDLSYFENPRLSEIRKIPELLARCGCIFRSLDAPNLYFPGVGLEGLGSTSWLYSICARTIMSHIKGTARLDMEPTGKLNHLDMVKHLAERDPGSFGGTQGWEAYREMAMNLADEAPFPMP